MTNLQLTGFHAVCTIISLPSCLFVLFFHSFKLFIYYNWCTQISLIILNDTCISINTFFSTKLFLKNKKTSRTQFKFALQYQGFRKTSSDKGNLECKFQFCLLKWIAQSLVFLIYKIKEIFWKVFRLQDTVDFCLAMLLYSKNNKWNKN